MPKALNEPDPGTEPDISSNTNEQSMNICRVGKHCTLKSSTRESKVGNSATHLTWMNKFSDERGEVDGTMDGRGRRNSLTGRERISDKRKIGWRRGEKVIAPCNEALLR